MTVRFLLVRTSKNTGVMFLCEVALGKENTITRDDHTLKKAPAGFDSVVARGTVEPGTAALRASEKRNVSFRKKTRQCFLAFQFKSDPPPEDPLSCGFG